MTQPNEIEAPESMDDDFEDAVIEEIAEEAAPLIPLDDPAQQKRLIEALLFASPEPISLRAIQNRLPATADVGAILLELQADYAERGVNLVRLEDVWAFRTPPDLGAQLVLTKKEEKKLSRAALETLAIIAYHQPVTRAEVENIRGVATSKGTLDVLMEAGWIKPGKRLETPGRPLTWITTNVFLDEFGISELKDLPGLQELKASGLLDTRPAIDTIPGAADLFGANENKQAASEDDADSDEEDDTMDGDAYRPTENDRDPAPEVQIDDDQMPKPEVEEDRDEAPEPEEDQDDEEKPETGPLVSVSAAVDDDETQDDDDDQNEESDEDESDDEDADDDDDVSDEDDEDDEEDDE